MGDAARSEDSPANRAVIRLRHPMAPVAGNPAGLDNPNDGRAEQQAGPRAGPGTEASGYLFDAARGPAIVAGRTSRWLRARRPRPVRRASGRRRAPGRLYLSSFRMGDHPEHLT